MNFWPLRKWQTVSLFLAIAALTVGLRLHSLQQPTPPDMCVYAYIGQEMLSGHTLYNELVDNKPPGIYVAYMLAMALGGYRSQTVVWLGVVLTVASLLFIFLILRAVAGQGAAFVGAVAWALVSNCLHLFANVPNTESFINVFLLAGFWLLLRAWPARPRLLGLSGLAFAVASVFKTNAVFIQAAVGLVIFGLAWRRPAPPNLRDAWQKTARFLLPTVLAWGAIFLYFQAQGIWDEF